MVKAPVLLFKSPDVRKYRAPDTDICTNCPLVECFGSDEAPSAIRRRKIAPECPRDYVVWLGVDVSTAESLALETLAGPGSRGYRNLTFRVAVEKEAAVDH